jgi:AcrR family transcriptional regulator
MVKEKSDGCFFFKKTPPSENTKDLILEEARKQFSEKGFVGTSVRDVCDAVGANVSAIKYHFGGKEGLYRECFFYHGRESLQRAEKYLTKSNTVEEAKLRLKLFAEEFIKDGLENSQTTRMICREIENQNPIIQDIFETTFLKTYTLFVEFFSDAQNKGLIRNDLSAQFITSIIFNSLTASMRADHVAEKHFNLTLKSSEYRDQFINNIVAIMFDGIKTQEQ